jgi:hypothetical protein
VTFVRQTENRIHEPETDQFPLSKKELTFPSFFAEKNVNEMEQCKTTGKINLKGKSLRKLLLRDKFFTKTLCEKKNILRGAFTLILAHFNIMMSVLAFLCLAAAAVLN